MTSRTDSAPLHLILGSGQIGPMVAERLIARGVRVRIGRQSAAPSTVRGVETVTLDVRDPAQVAAAARDAAVVYQCTNPPYDRWPELLLPMIQGITTGTARAGARLVALDCMYMYGDTSHIDERTPVAPRSKKGALRAEAGRILLEADARGDLPVSIGRAADFFGPAARLALFGERFFPRVFAGQSFQIVGDPDQPHAYTYTPDVAEALVALGTCDAAKARGLWMLPTQPAESTRALVNRFEKALGQPIAVSRLPNWLLRATGLVIPMLREVAEMTYQWEQPYRVDDSKFRANFGFGPTAWEPAVEATVAWARSAFPTRRAA